MEEIWKDIPEYEGSYQVSNLGRVRSLDRKNSINKFVKGKVLKQGNNSEGYKLAVICKNSKMRTFKIHRLVAQAFIPNIENKPQVNHIDESKDNNIFTNLEWVTAKENVNYGTSLERMSKKHFKKIKVIYSDNTYEIWPSAVEFAKQNNIKVQNIYRVLSGGREKTYGMRFERVIS